MISNIRKSFNHAAKSYDENCHLQKSIGDKLIDLMTPHCTTTNRIIDLGCGTGVVTEKLAAKLPYQEFHAIDFADQLLEKAASRLTPSGIKVYPANFDKLPKYTEPFDIIFSNMALHWSANFQQTLELIISRLNAGGIIAFAIPLAGTLKELRSNFSINQFHDADFVSNQLVLNNSELLVSINKDVTLQFKDTISALRSIKNVGANAAIQTTSAQILGKSILNNVTTRTLTYNIGYFIARKMR